MEGEDGGRRTNESDIGGLPGRPTRRRSAMGDGTGVVCHANTGESVLAALYLVMSGSPHPPHVPLPQLPPQKDTPF